MENAPRPIRKIAFVNRANRVTSQFDTSLPASVQILCTEASVHAETNIQQFAAQNECDGILFPQDIYDQLVINAGLVDKIDEGLVILGDANEILWGNKCFLSWFAIPNSSPVHNSLVGQDFYYALGRPIFQRKAGFSLDPLTQTRTTGQIANGNFILNNNRYFEMQVKPYNEVEGHSFLIVSVRDVRERQEMEERLNAIYKVSVELNQITKEELLDMTPEERRFLLSDGIAYAAQNVMKYDILEVRIYSPLDNSLDLFTQYGLTDEARERHVILREDNNGINAHVAETLKPYYCPDTSKDPRYLKGGIDARSSLTLPILFHEQLLGVLNVESRQLDAFSEMDTQFMQIFAREIGISLNTLALLDEEKRGAIQTSVTEIHRELSLPVNEILSDSVALNEQINKLFPEDQIAAALEAAANLKSLADADPLVQVKLMLYSIIKKSRDMNQRLRRIGNEMPRLIMAEEDENAEGEDDDVMVVQRVLLFDPNDDYLRQGIAVLSNLGYEVEVTHDAAKVLSMARQLLDEGTPYYAILIPIEDINGYTHRTRFFQDLGDVYGENRHPPLVLLSAILQRDNAHTVVNVRRLFPMSQNMGRQLNEVTTEKIQKTLRNAAELAANAKPNLNAIMQTYPTADGGSVR